MVSGVTSIFRQNRRPGIILAATAAATALVAALARGQGAASGWAWLLIAAVWVFGALIAAAIQNMPLVDLGIVPIRPAQTLRLLLLAGAIVFPLLFAGVWLMNRAGHALPLLPAIPSGEWARWALFQIAYVAAPEELFFRGYAQGSLRLWLRSQAPGRPQLCDVLALAAAAVLFAGAHVVVFHSAVQAWVFFPALLFGWLRVRTGGIWAPITFHGCANIAYAVAGAVFSAAG